MRTFRDVHVLSRVVTVGADSLEKQRAYDEACACSACLFLAFLSSLLRPFPLHSFVLTLGVVLERLLQDERVPHGRGHWYDRLAVNLG